MKKLLFILFILPIFSFGQLKVAILDFENTSGIDKYDGLGKAMSNMLITDLKNNIHPRKVIFMERSQLNKILDEQNLQKSKKFDNKTVVEFGKLSGVDFVIIGSVYVLDNICNISSRMVNVKTSEIEYSKEVNGAISDWIKLKSDLAIEFANIVNNPISIENSDQTTSEGVLVQYAKIIEAIDQENINLAEGMIQMMKDLQVDFNYLDFLSEDIQKIKERLEDLELELEISVTDPMGSANNFYYNEDYINSIKYLKIGRNRLGKNNIGGLIDYYYLLYKSYLQVDIKKSSLYCDSILEIYPHLEFAVHAKAGILIYNNNNDQAIVLLKSLISNYEDAGDAKVFRKLGYDWLERNGIDRRGGGVGVSILDSYNFKKGYKVFGTFQGLNTFAKNLHFLLDLMDVSNSHIEIIEYLESINFIHKKMHKDQFEVNFALGWYYLKNNQLEESVQTYSDILDYFKDGFFDKERDVLYSAHWESSYFGKNSKSNNVTQQSVYIMSCINLGHAYLCLGNIEEAANIYSSYNFEFFLSDTKYSSTYSIKYEMTIKEALMQDWEELDKNGILSKQMHSQIKRRLNL